MNFRTWIPMMTGMLVVTMFIGSANAGTPIGRTILEEVRAVDVEIGQVAVAIDQNDSKVINSMAMTAGSRASALEGASALDGAVVAKAWSGKQKSGGSSGIDTTVAQGGSSEIVNIGNTTRLAANYVGLGNTDTDPGDWIWPDTGITLFPAAAHAQA